MPRPPSTILLKTWAGKMPRPPQYMLAGRLQKIWTNKELFVYLFVMILAIFWLKRLSSWGVPNLPLTE